MRKLTKSVAVLTALCALLALVSACGEKPADVAGSGEKWGNLSVFVPEGMYLMGGGYVDFENPNALLLQSEEAPENFYLIEISDEKTADGALEKTLGKEKSREVRVNEDETEWSGACYKSDKRDGFFLSAKLGEKTVTVSSLGFAYNETTTRTVLRGIALK